MDLGSAQAALARQEAISAYLATNSDVSGPSSCATRRCPNCCHFMVTLKRGSAHQWGIRGPAQSKACRHGFVPPTKVKPSAKDRRPAEPPWGHAHSHLGDARQAECSITVQCRHPGPPPPNQKQYEFRRMHSAQPQKPQVPT